MPFAGPTPRAIADDFGLSAGDNGFAWTQHPMHARDLELFVDNFGFSAEKTWSAERSLAYTHENGTARAGEDLCIRRTQRVSAS